MADLLADLQKWYVTNCDGEWEHLHGIHIGTIDNPGWRLTINLAGTSLQDKPFDRFQSERTEDDWMHCWVKENEFHAAGGPENLSDMIRAFLEWANG